MVVDFLQQRFGGGDVRSLAVVPRIEMYQRFWRQALCPILAGENRAVGKFADVTDAQIGDGNDVGGDAENFGERVVAHDADPSEAEALGARGQPQVLDGEAGRIISTSRMLVLPSTAGPKRSGLQVTIRLSGASRMPSSLSERYFSRRSPLN